MGRIRGFMNEYFRFSRGERNGTFILAMLMVLVFAYPHIHGFIKNDDGFVADPEFSDRVKAFYGAGDGAISTVISEPAIALPATQTSVSPGQNPSRSLEKIEINDADTIELMRVKGIGPVLSRRIIRYREILGGYNDLTQLHEVYGIDSVKYLEISPSLYADTARIVKLSLLSGHFGVLLRHPYLDYNQVADIFRLREERNLYAPDDLLQSTAFSASDIKRLFPYLDFN